MLRALLPAVLLAAVDGVAGPQESEGLARWDMVSFEVRSWGRPVTSWRLLANGSGSWTETVAR